MKPRFANVRNIGWDVNIYQKLIDSRVLFNDIVNGISYFNFNEQLKCPVKYRLLIGRDVVVT